MPVKYMHNYVDVKNAGLPQVDGFVGTVVDLDSKLVVGFVGCHAFCDVSIKAIAPNRRIFDVFGPDDEDPLRVYGVTLKDALMALGLGNHYAEEWGDYRDLLEQLRKHSVVVFEAKHSRLLDADVDLAVQEILPVVEAAKP